MQSDTRNRLVYAGWIFEPFSAEALQSPFDCGDPDLNDFFANDLLAHEDQLITKTYLLMPEGMTVRDSCPVAFISFCNDSIRRESFKTQDARSSLDALPERKRYPALPAVKIARLGVQLNFHDKDIGTFVLNVTKALFRCHNRTGCRFITVDAYNNDKVIGFYSKNLFAFLTDKDESNEHRTMFFDLKRTPEDEIAEVAQSLSVAHLL